MHQHLIIMMVLEVSIIVAISMLGFWELAPLGYVSLLTIAVYLSAVIFLVNDQLEVHLIGKIMSPQ
jgi:hypothetical protein